MENNSDETLYTICSNSDPIFRSPSDNRYVMCCCITEKWCFEHSGIAGLKEYDETKNNCCKCLDCCTWCLEFNYKTRFNCLKDTYCYLCCLSINFT
jgi:hypothetical protein